MKVHTGTGSIKGLVPFFLVLFSACAPFRFAGDDPGYHGPYRVPEISERPLPYPGSFTVRSYLDDFHSLPYRSDRLMRFYHDREYRPVWTSRGEPNELARQLLFAIDEARYHGLEKSDYLLGHLYYSIRELEKEREETGMVSHRGLARLDVLFTRACLEYASDLLSGKTDPSGLDITWEARPVRKDLAAWLQEAAGEGEIYRSLEALNPRHPQYPLLKSSLEELIERKGSAAWPSPGEVPHLQRGDTGIHVLRIRRLLRSTGDLPAVSSGTGGNKTFGATLELAVRKFQRRHGLETDGIIGPETLVEMNRSIDYRIRQIRVNMERLRWMPRELGEEYIVVNLPDFSLSHFSGDSLLSRMKVIIGEEENVTPLLTDTLIYIEFNPEWNIPHSIATEELLPRIKEDSGYLDKHHYVLLEGYSYDSDPLNPDSIDWSEVTEEEFPYLIKQKSGPWNALGEMKFIFPNRQAVYMHDTPSDHLFRRGERDLSHGCIRLERPADLAVSLLRNREEVNRDSITAFVNDTVRKRIFLREPVPVYFTYQTASVDREGMLQFRRDVYGLDEKQYFLLKGIPRYYRDPLGGQRLTGMSMDIEARSLFNGLDDLLAGGYR